MSRYDFTYTRLQTLLPIVLRKPKLIALLTALLTPIDWLYSQFTTFRTAKEYRLSHNGQIFSLEKVICDFCNNSNCYITDGELRSEILVPYSGDGTLSNYQVLIPYDGSVLPQLSINYEGDGFETYADFIVHLPTSLYNNIDEIALRAIIDEYKLAGKFYKIEYLNILQEVYSFAWSNMVCTLTSQQDAEYNFAWSNQICVLGLVESYSFAWSYAICARQYEADKYSFAWATNICAQVEDVEVYSFAWTNEICVKSEKRI